MPVTTAVAAVDHPAHATLDHALIVDFLNPSRAPGGTCGRRAERRVGA